MARDQIFIYVDSEEKKLFKSIAFKMGMSESALGAALILPAARRLEDLPEEQVDGFRKRLEQAREG